jgi:small subunit ribosomal protein S4
MKRQRKKHTKPFRPWDKTRIDKERKLMDTYGLRRKKELWRVESILRNYRRMARNLAAKIDKEQEKVLLDKVFREGLLEKGQELDDVLALNTEKLLERRLQTMVFRKNLSTTPKQARQLIVHGHIAVDDRRIVWPSMIINRELEDKIKFYGKSKIKSVKDGKTK